MKIFFKRFIFISIIILPVFFLSAPSWAKIDADKFDQVDEGLYRGAQPSDNDLSELKKMGVKTVINLRTFNVNEEKGKVEKLGLRYVSLPMSGGQAFEDYETTSEKFLKVATDPSNRPVYVHCNYGIYRTGTMVAFYRMVRDNWSLEAAVKEMEKYGFKGSSNPHLVKFLTWHSQRKRNQ